MGADDQDLAEGFQIGPLHAIEPPLVGQAGTRDHPACCGHRRVNGRTCRNRVAWYSRDRCALHTGLPSTSR